MDRQVISKLAEVDPTFVQVVKALYGDSADPREHWDLIKAMPDQSSTHVQGQGSSKRKRALLGAGLVAGTGIEALAAHKTIAPLVHDIHEARPAWKAATTTSSKLKTLKPMVPHGGGKGKRGLGTGTEAALMGGNALVGLGAAGELLKKPKKQRVTKGFLVPRVSKATLRAANLKAAKQGRRELKGLATAGATGGAFAGGYAVGKRPKKLVKVPPQKSEPVKKSLEVDYEWAGEISKVDQDKRLVFGWCSLSKLNGEPVVDLQGDYIPIEETEASAYRYVIESRKGGDMHRRVQKFDEDQPFHTADLVESMVITPEKLQKMGLPPDALPHGWWIGMKVNDDEQWDNVKNGKRLGFSIHGKGRRVEKALD